MRRRGQRLFAEHMFSGVECGDGQVRVRQVRRADIDDVDIGITE